MSIKTRERYNEEFKVEAVKLVTERGYSLTQAAKSLGVSVDSISKWKKRLEETSSPRIAFPGNGNMNAIDKEKMILEKEIKKLQIERDILKKALAYFANPQG
ncbi:transposase (plasmid) [Candidatus Bandiella numerosa]|uniref:transposase n=1 Tax=Candidatus Bandiella numerosa TaxID=2570586 RepID=UPI00249F4EF5|nr:transposase [Candidatus Bandiella numerosa]WHA05743.1 transposase [Candidatus Bandiella numerosa]